MLSRKAFSVSLSAVLLFGAMAPPSARADEPGWKLIQTEGPVEISVSGAGFAPIALNNTIQPGSILRTGSGGRVVIENNGDRITVAPNSEIDLPRQETGATMVQVKQPIGTLLYDMVPRGIDRFKVETPYLAAVIKGTVFTVNVTTEGAAVQVLRGIVQVANGDGQFASLVHPGQTATVPARRDGAIRLMGRPPASSPRTAEPQHSSVTPAASPPPVTGGADSTHPKITQPIGPHTASIGSLTSGLITNFAPSVSPNGKPSGANATQLASLPDADGAATSDNSNANSSGVSLGISDGNGDSGSSTGNDDGKDNGKDKAKDKGKGNSGNSNGATAVSSPTGIASSTTAGATLGGMATTVASPASPIISGIVTGGASAAAAITSSLGVGNDNNGNGNGNGNSGKVKDKGNKNK